MTDQIERWQPSHPLVFDEGGLTGHPDHRQATRAALAAAERASQSTANAVLAQRLRLLGDTENLRLLYSPDPGGTAMTYAYATRLPEPFSPALVERVREALRPKASEY